ncbi:MAG: hypothetical protein GY857_12800, partial [Desulfobacula sp.]|nr:hypothetical protein [Desulfobacula sp.]
MLFWEKVIREHIMYRALIQLLIFQFRIIRILFKSKDDLVLVTIKLRQQLATYQAKKERPENITEITRSLLVALKRTWPKWMHALIIVKPETVICWQQKRFKKYWTEKSAKKNKPGRPSVKLEICELIKRMASE